MTQTFETAAGRAGFTLDDSQRAAARRLTRLGEEIAGRRRFLRRGATPRSLYLWGPVGRGKSWLADVFFDSLDLRHKRRFHFHEFFREFHTAYARHRTDRRACDLAVASLLEGCGLLYFDEFHVHDPGDAVMMGRVLTSLFQQRIPLLATSNYAPCDLLPNPVHRPLFESTIALLERSMDIVEVAGPADYRSAGRPEEPRAEFQRGFYLWPGAEEQLAAAGLAPPTAGERCAVTTGGRDLPALAVRGRLVWFDFDELCDSATSTGDYLSLTDRFDTWVLSGLPLLTPGHRDAAQRFANLVDVLCDRDARLSLVGEGPLEACLRDGALPIDMNRTISRLGLLRTLTGPDGGSVAVAPAPGDSSTGGDGFHGG